MKHVDPDGKLTIVTAGTWAEKDATFRANGAFFGRVMKSIPDRAYVSFRWSGSNTSAGRSNAARSMASLVRHYNFAPGEQLNMVDHSHGGNVGIEAINLGLGRKVDNLITLGTPVRDDYSLKNPSSVGNFIAVSNVVDPVQVLGGNLANSPLFGEWGPAGRVQPGASNILIDTAFFPDANLHSEFHESPLVWDIISAFIDTQDARPSNPETFEVHD
jgi:hypothetical protein